VTAALAWARARPAATAAAAALAAVALVRYGVGGAGLIAAFTCAVLVGLSVIDVESRRLPNRIVLPTAAVVLLARLATAPERWDVWLLAGACAFGGFLALALASPGALGMGDVKLGALLGVALGGAVLPALVIGTLSASVAGLILVVRHGREARKRAIPFGPFLAAGAIATFLLLTP
jgi:leader peptidase (prepilin peptidase) / N-methyltransferase